MHQRLLVLTTFILFAMTSIAQELQVPLYAPGQIPNYQKTDETEKTENKDLFWISNVQQPTVTVFLPTRRTATGQAMVICPGGGYSSLAFDWEGTDIAKWLNSKGITAFVLKYRLPGSKSNIVPNKSPLLDAKRAIRLVRANAEKWHIDKAQVGIMGFSAGGHLASTLATHFDAGDPTAKDTVERFSSRPDFAVLVYPVITMSQPEMHRGSRDQLLGKTPNEELEKYYSNDLQVTDQTPPTLLIHATDDGAVPVENSLLFYKALKDHKVTSAMHIYPRGGHGFGLGLGIAETDTWPNSCIDWLRALKK